MKKKNKVLEDIAISSPEVIIKITREESETRCIVRLAYIHLLKRFNYNISKLIEELEIPRQTFYNKLAQYDIRVRYKDGKNRKGKGII